MTCTIAKAVDTIRVLSADAVQEANSGHPGMPMGGADFAFTLWSKHLRFNPKQPSWQARDRFILSTGHGSMLLYSLLHLFECGLSLEDIKNFRQWESLTPGHPEFGHTAGVDVTTGPLGSGFASAVGMAMAAKQLQAKMKNSELFDQRMYVILGDGCHMEGCTSEAASLAGHLKLDNIIAFYDDNQITIEGSTDLAFSENVGARFEAYGWHVMYVDGHNVEQIDQALIEAKTVKGKPTMIIGRTVIAKGSPNKAGTADAHGAPLGAEEVKLVKQALGFSPDQSFFIPEDVKDYCHQIALEKQVNAEATELKITEFFAANCAEKELYSKLVNKEVPANILEELLDAVVKDKSTASRNSSGECVQRISKLVPAFAGGSADLGPSCKSDVKAESSFSADNYLGRNFHYGVREFGMALCANGQSLYGTMLPYTSTFFVFCDYMKPAMRLAALQNLQQIYVFTHDSFYVGEDGPTHQPIEQLSMLRGIPGLSVIRPADARESAHAWAVALQHNGPTALLFTRQNLPQIPQEFAGRIAVEKGAYVVDEDIDFEAIIIATGSEVGVALAAAKIIREAGKKVRIVSMPSWDRFDAQSSDYRESVIPSTCRKRISLEAASTFGWDKYTGFDGIKIGLDHFGASAPAEILADKFGINPEAVAAKVLNYLG
ncbi:MAG: transketolase [Lentisphaeria bacterium]